MYSARGINFTMGYVAMVEYYAVILKSLNLMCITLSKESKKLKNVNSILGMIT